MYEALPKNEAHFDIETVGADTGIKYKGQFRVKCLLDIAGKHSLALEKTRLMADYANPSGDLQAIAIALATLRAKIIEGPAWWADSDGGSSIMDENVILEIFDECNKAEEAWRKKLKKSAEVAQEMAQTQEATQ